MLAVGQNSATKPSTAASMPRNMKAHQTSPELLAYSPTRSGRHLRAPRASIFVGERHDAVPFILAGRGI